ncbi:MAG: pilus assembly protein [Pseudomonadota bacterium]
MHSYSQTLNHQTGKIQAPAHWQLGLRLLVICSIGLLTACAESTPYYNSKFGDAARETFNQQIANPEAVNNNNPVKGIDGRAAHDAVESYQKSFVDNVPEKSSNTLSIGVGGNSSK